MYSSFSSLYKRSHRNSSSIWTSTPVLDAVDRLSWIAVSSVRCGLWLQPMGSAGKHCVDMVAVISSSKSPGARTSNRNWFLLRSRAGKSKFDRSRGDACSVSAVESVVVVGESDMSQGLKSKLDRSRGDACFVSAAEAIGVVGKPDISGVLRNALVGERAGR